MNSSLASISRTTGADISFSCSESLRFLKKSCASLMESEESSRILRPLSAPSLTFPTLVEKEFPSLVLRRGVWGEVFKNTFNAPTRSLAPLHVSHTSSPPKYLVPKPLQAGQAP